MEFCRSHQSVLHPAFDLQRRLRDKCGGASFWASHTQNRGKTGLAKVGTPDQLRSRLRESAEQQQKGKQSKPKAGAVSPVAEKAALIGDQHYLTAGRRKSLTSQTEMGTVAGSVADRRAAAAREARK